MCRPAYFPRDHISHLNSIRIQPQRLISARRFSGFMTISRWKYELCARCPDARLTWPCPGQPAHARRRGCYDGDAMKIVAIDTFALAVPTPQPMARNYAAQ